MLVSVFGKVVIYFHVSFIAANVMFIFMCDSLQLTLSVVTTFYVSNDLCMSHVKALLHRTLC